MYFKHLLLCVIFAVAQIASAGTHVDAHDIQPTQSEISTTSFFRNKAVATANARGRVGDVFALAKNIWLRDQDYDAFIDPRVVGRDRILARRLMKYMPSNLRGDFVYTNYRDRMVSNNVDLLKYATISPTRHPVGPPLRKNVPRARVLRKPAYQSLQLQSHSSNASFHQDQYHRMYVNSNCSPPGSDTGAYARNYSACGFTTGWGFVTVPCGLSAFAPNDSGYLYMELTGSGAGVSYGKSEVEGGLQYNNDSSVQPYLRSYGDYNGYITLNNSTAKYACGQNLAVLHGATYDASYTYTAVGQVPSNLNPASNWVSYGAFTLQNQAWLFQDSNDDISGAGTDNYGVHTPCTLCSITQVTSIGQNYLQQGQGYDLDGSYFGVSSSGDAVHWMQVAFGEWESNCEPGTSLCTFLFPPDPEAYLGALQTYPSSQASQDFQDSLGWGAYETYDAIDLTGGGIPASSSRAAGAFNEPHPPYPCNVDSQAYCSVNLGTGITNSCQLGTKPNGQPTYINGSSTSYEIYHTTDVFRYVELATYRKIVTSNGDGDGTACSISYSWSPQEPKVQFGDSNLP